MNKKGAGLRPFIIGIILIIASIFFIYSFVYHFETAVNPDSQILDSKYGLQSGINEANKSMESFKTMSDNARNSLSGSSPDATAYIFLIFQGAFEIPKAIFGFMVAAINLLVTTLFPSLGGTGMGSIVTMITTLISVGLIISLVLLVIKFIRSGESER